MTGSVELRPDLANLGRHEFIVTNEFSWTERHRSAGRQTGDGQLETAHTEHGHVGLVYLAQGATLPSLTNLTALSTIADVVRLTAPALSSLPHSLGAHFSVNGLSLADDDAV